MIFQNDVTTFVTLRENVDSVIRNIKEVIKGTNLKIRVIMFKI